jgi:hypothetical protein
MFNVLKNTTLLQDDKLRLISLNRNFNNKIYLYILLSLYKNKLSNYSQDELNQLSKFYKEELKKYVKKKFNINYLNLNLNKHLNILSELLNTNLTIYNKDFNNIKFQSQTNYKKSLYFLLKNKNLYLVSNKNKDNLSYRLKNNLFNSLPLLNAKQLIQTNILLEGGAPPLNNIGLWDPSKVISFQPQSRVLQESYYKDDKNWYSIVQVNKFLISRCKDCLSGMNEARKATTDIYTATFTNVYRDYIYRIINNINNKFEEYVNNQGGALYEVKLVIAGGDCFNHLLLNQLNRPISPDIDVKLVINNESGNNLHLNYEANNFNYENKKYDIFNYNIVLLSVRNKLNEYLLEEIQNLNNNKNEYFNTFTQITKNLYDYCVNLMAENNITLPLSEKDNTPYIPGLKSKSRKRISKFQKRFNHMESGYQNKNNLDEPFRINNVLLYSIDCIYEVDGNRPETSFTGIPGILDIVISLPTHAGYMIQNRDYVSKVYNSINLSIMDKNYYIVKDNLKMVDYGLRTMNKKILKDFARLSLLLGEDPYLVVSLTKDGVLQKMQNTIKKLLTNSNFQLETDKEKLNQIKGFLECIIPTKRERNSRNNLNQSKSKKIHTGSGGNKCDINVLKRYDNSFDLEDSYEPYFGEEEDNQPKSLFNKIKNTLFGGSIDQIVVCYKVPKSLYFMISDNIETHPSINNSLKSPYINKYLTTINNNNEQTNKLDNKNIIKINYERLTELTQGNPSNRENKLNNSLTESFNSSALLRFHNKSFNKWAIDNRGNKTKKLKLVQELLQNITNELRRDNNFIRKLYFFDIDEVIMQEYKESYPQNFKEYEKQLNSEVAECLLHTFMYAFSPEFIQQDIIYQRFKSNEEMLEPFHRFYMTIQAISEGKHYERFPPNITVQIEPINPKFKM